MFKMFNNIANFMRRMVVICSNKGKGGMRPLIKDFGVRLRRVKKVAGEIERKMFHLSGVGVPVLWLYLQHHGHDRYSLLFAGWCIVATGWAADILRVYVPFVQRNWPLKKILRKKNMVNYVVLHILA